MVKNLLNPTNIRINYVKVVKKSNFRVQFEFDSAEQRNSVKSLVSYQIPGAKYSSAVKSGRWDGTKTFLTETNTLPVGIFKSLFPEHEFVYNKAHAQLSYDDIPLYRNKPNLDRRQYQLDAINTIFQHKYGLINCVMGSGKCLGKDTPVIMFDGTLKKVQDIVPGDKLLGPDGTIRNVLSTTSGMDELYKITPVKGDSFITNSVHLLSLKLTGGVSSNFYLADGTKIDKDSTSPIFVEAQTFYRSNESTKCRLKAWRPESLEFPVAKKPLNIPPYILGIWLGDGSANQPELTSVDSELVNAWSNYATSIGCKIKNIATATKTPRYFLSKDSAKHNLFTKSLESYSLRNNKHIPLEYKTACTQARLELLAGLLDTDGSLSGGGFDFIQKSEILADDVVFLARSLGLAAYKTTCQKTIKSINFKGTYFRVSISGDCSIIPTKLPRKRATKRTQIKNVLRTGITVEKAGYGEYYGFEIDGDRQFLLGDWQVTHNTLIAAATCTYHLKQNPKNKILFIVYDVNILTQTIRTFTSYGLKVTQFGNSIKDLSGDVVVATIQSLNNVKEPSKSLKDITFIFLDEAHHGKSKTSKSIISKIPNAEYRIGLTATPHKENTLDLAELLAVTGPVIYEYGFTEAIQDNKIAPVKAFFLDVDPDWDIKEQVITRKNYKVIWDAAIQTNKTRNQLISNALHYLVELLDTTNLVLVDRTEHGTALCASMRSRSTIRATTMYGSDDIVMREIKKTHLQKEGDDTINTIVSTVVKEGVDFSVSPVIAVNASGRKSFINLIQFLGRITRANEKFGTWRQYIDFIDNYHPLLRQHSYDRINACKQFGIDVIIVHSLKELLDETVKYYKECKVRDGNL